MLTQFTKKCMFMISILRCKVCPFKNETPSLQCDGCGYLFDPNESLQGVNLFDLYKIPLQYNIQKEQVVNKFKQYQKKYHPDKFIAKNNIIGQHSTSLSSTLTDGKQILLDDIKRASYILGLKGIKLSGDDNTVPHVDDPQLIQQVFQLNCLIMQSQDLIQLQSLLRKANKKIQSFKRTFSKNFDNKQYQQCRLCLQKMKYFNQIKIAVESKLDKLGKAV